MADDKKPSIFNKVIEASAAILDAQIAKAQNSIEKSAKKEQENEADFNWGKAITRDRNYYIGSQGFQEKPGSLTYEYQKQMAIKSSIISAIIKTRQNRVAAYSQYMPEGAGLGFKIVFKNEQEELDKIREELFGEPATDGEPDEGQEVDSAAKPSGEPKISESEMIKAAKPDEEPAAEGEQEVDVAQMGDLATATEDEVPEEPPTEEDMLRECKKELERRTKGKKRKIASFLLHSGEQEDRPFETKKWTFDAYLRAIVWDSMVYDQIATELVPKQAEYVKGKINVHHYQPVDGSTVRYASQELSKYKTADMQLTQDILYPEAELKALEERDALQLDDTKLASNQYKYVQLVRGKIQRAFTEDELKVGMRNPTSDIYCNGYSISELEMLVALITSHLQTEFYNRSYFQQGFSAKGILHIKANLNRSKLEELRRHWNHMVKGNRNSFQTPIMAGMDEVQWIPLTQSHSEMEFSMWLNYLIKMICAIYQIDPAEIGYGLKEEGGSGSGGLAGDNTAEKLKNSKDKGFVPVMKFLQDYINKNIVDNLDSDYMMEWVGLEEETAAAKVARQKEEVQWKKTINEIRSEDGLPPIKGADHLVLNPVFFNWYSQFSEEGKKMMEKAQQQQADAAAQQMGAEGDPKQQWEADEASAENNHMRDIESKTLDHGHKMEQASAKAKAKPKPKAQVKKSFAKSVKIEYYRIGT